MIARPPSARLLNKKISSSSSSLIDSNNSASDDYLFDKSSIAPKQSSHPTPTTTINSGRWQEWEHEAFLKGLDIYGKGRWKKIQSLIPTRTTTQIKSHAQVVLNNNNNTNSSKRRVEEDDMMMMCDDDIDIIKTPNYNDDRDEDMSYEPDEYDAMRCLSVLRTILHS